MPRGLHSTMASSTSLNHDDEEYLTSEFFAYRMPCTQARRIIIKVGALAEVIQSIVQSGRQVVLVICGANTVGSMKLRYQQILTSSPLQLQQNSQKPFLPPECSSCGQSGLMSLWDKMFHMLGMLCAQLLVSEHDFASESFCDNLRTTVEDLLNLGVVPMLNENQCSDMTWKEQHTLLDNDGLAALTAEQLGADLVLFLTTADGVPASPPSTASAPPHAPSHTHTPAILSTFCPELHGELSSLHSLRRNSIDGSVGSHGVADTRELDDRSARSMRSKITAAWRCAEAGSTAVIMNGLDTDNIWKVLHGEKVGTLFSKQAALDMTMRGADMMHVVKNTLHQDASGVFGGGRGLVACSLAEIAMETRKASRQLASLPSSARADILRRIADALEDRMDDILKANFVDVTRSQADGATSGRAALQRLALDEQRVLALARSMRDIAAMEDPIDELLSRREIAEDLILEQRTVPIGVLLAIVEGRADVLPQIAALTIRSGNGVLMQCSEEASHTNVTLHNIITAAIGPTCSPALVTLVHGREEVDDLLQMNDQVDLIITRGSAALHRHISDRTSIPVLGHTDGLCNIYIDKDVDLQEACAICVDAKTDYAVACNAVEKVLVHRAHRERGGIFQLLSALRTAGITVYGAPSVKTLLGVPAAPSLRAEYHDVKVTLDVVDDLEDAIGKIHAYGSAHTDAICTSNAATAESFLQRVDSACVFANCSTRFSDGWRFGLGAEVGISTGRIHARGPVGALGLMTTKFLLRGRGQVVAKDQGVTYTHRSLPLGTS